MSGTLKIGFTNISFFEMLNEIIPNECIWGNSAKLKIDSKICGQLNSKVTFF